MCFKKKGPRGFTFIEILMALAIMAVLFLPVMQLFSTAIVDTASSLDLITATSLAKSHMERTINLNLTAAQMKQIGDEFYPPLKESPLVINHTAWRVKRELVEGSDPLEVRIRVYRDSDMQKELVTLVTLMEDMMWEFVKPVTEMEK